MNLNKTRALLPLHERTSLEQPVLNLNCAMNFLGKFGQVIFLWQMQSTKLGHSENEHISDVLQMIMR